PAETGLQRNNSHDWWPKMVMLKILKQYHSATGDQRVIDLLTKYFQFQLKHLPEEPLGHWTFWAEYRACDNLMVIYWLYNITGDKFLLDLADLIHKQAFDFTGAFLSGDHLSRQGSLHCVNLAQGIKEPMVYYQQHPDQKYLDATRKAFSDLRKYMGQSQGLFGGDEALHGNNPTQGSELCSAVEMMFSLETILQITGDIQYADHLEKVAFNALPTQITDDFTARQYFQQPNQVMATRHFRNFDVNHDGTDVCFGLFTGYPCCTSNMHQGWPKFTQNLFYATPDRGIAALVYAPSRVKARVGDGVEAEIIEETDYPFRDKVNFTVRLSERQATFPFHLRIPSWCKNPELTINGQQQIPEIANNILIIHREWDNSDRVELRLPMKIEVSTWHENSNAIERGPLVYALKIGEKWEKVTNTRDPERYGKEFWEVRPTTSWNYGLLNSQVKNADSLMMVAEKPVSPNPWNPENAPVELNTRGIRIPSWQLFNEMAGPLPWSDMYKMDLGENPSVEEITLIPYGCTTLRISEFPVLR
ncbi:MAG TPA: glycoside hydrolase family 127 protein, partial [Prolixibacteraceae bacterium]|nr:glycoside hydrolase family 127 protein [Prolixibacteraceae bacterium]